MLNEVVVGSNGGRTKNQWVNIFRAEQHLNSWLPFPVGITANNHLCLDLIGNSLNKCVKSGLFSIRYV